MDVDSIIEIDQSQLDLEWVNQPKRYYQYATALADARLTLEESKAELDVTEAEVSKAIRRNPDKYGLNKVTDKAVAEAVILSDDYQAAVASVSKAKWEVDVLQAAVTALDHRKKALEKLVELHGQNYFSTPRASEEGQRAVTEKSKRKSRSNMGVRDD